VLVSTLEAPDGEHWRRRVTRHARDHPKASRVSAVPFSAVSGARTQARIHARTWTGSATRVQATARHAVRCIKSVCHFRPARVFSPCPARVAVTRALRDSLAPGRTQRRRKRLTPPSTTAQRGTWKAAREAGNLFTPAPLTWSSACEGTGSLGLRA